MHPQDGLDSPFGYAQANGKSLTMDFFGQHRRCPNPQTPSQPVWHAWPMANQHRGSRCRKDSIVGPHRPMHPQDAIDSPFGHAPKKSTFGRPPDVRSFAPRPSRCTFLATVAKKCICPRGSPDAKHFWPRVAKIVLFPRPVPDALFWPRVANMHLLPQTLQMHFFGHAWPTWIFCPQTLQMQLFGHAWPQQLLPWRVWTQRPCWPRVAPLVRSRKQRLKFSLATPCAKKAAFSESGAKDPCWPRVASAFAPEVRGKRCTFLATRGQHRPFAPDPPDATIWLRVAHSNFRPGRVYPRAGRAQCLPPLSDSEATPQV